MAGPWYARPWAGRPRGGRRDVAAVVLYLGAAACFLWLGFAVDGPQLLRLTLAVVFAVLGGTLLATLLIRRRR